MLKEFNERVIGWGERLGGGVLLVQCLHEDLGSREPVVFVYAIVFSSIHAESCSLGQGSCLPC